MRTRMDDNLNLEQLLTRCKVLEPELQIRIYFDPDTYLFYIHYLEEMAWFLPPTASLICECMTDGVRFEIERYIALSVRMATKAAKQ